MRTHVIRAGLLVVLVLGLGAPAHAARFADWTPAIEIEDVDGASPDLNTPWLDGCPILSPDGLSLYLASNRPRFEGDTRTDLDIWVAHRPSTDVGFGAPVNLGEPVNSTADDFCPTPVRGNGLFFVSRRVTAESCGLGDIYLTRNNPAHGWETPIHLACDPVGPNSALDEQGPTYTEADGAAVLHFSRSSATVPGDVFVSAWDGGQFTAAMAVVELNDATANDIQPNVRKDGREIVFSSNRAGTLGGQDIWVATRDSVDEPWSAPVNLGGAVNTTAGESRPSLSWDAGTLVFGRAPGPDGGSDIFITTRDRVAGPQ